ncbi:MAG: hypothetical protein RLZZ338_2366 [Cyanobacteriota bacterium]
MVSAYDTIFQNGLILTIVKKTPKSLILPLSSPPRPDPICAIFTKINEIFLNHSQESLSILEIT